MTKTKLALAAAMLVGASSFAMAQPTAQSLYELSITGAGTYEVPLQYGPRVAVRDSAQAAYAAAPVVRAERTLTDTIVW